MTPGALREVFMQRALDAYRAGRLDDARSASERLLSIGGLDEVWRAAALRNAVFYAPHLRELAPGLDRHPVPPAQDRLVARDPSPAVVGGRVLALIDEGDAPGESRPRRTVAGAALDPSGAALRRFEAPVAGGQDVARCRLAAAGPGGVALCAWLPGESLAVAMRLDPASLRLDSPMLVADPGGAEGSAWMPFERGGELLMVTRVQPARVVRASASGGVEVLAEREGPPILGRLDGSAPGVWFGDGWLFALRQFAVFEDGNRVALHRFAVLGEDLAWSHLSEPFRFGDGAGDDRVERCAGLALSGDRLLAGVGVEDREAWMYAIPLVEARSMLRPIAGWEDPELPPPIRLFSLRETLGREMPLPPRPAPAPEAREAAFAELRTRLAARAAIASPPPRAARRAMPEREPSEGERYRESLKRLEPGASQSAAGVCHDPMLAGGEIAELPWLAAWACWLAGEDARAVDLAGRAAALGWAGGKTPPPAPESAMAWFEGPADIQRHALKRMGADTDSAEQTFEAAWAARMAWEASRAAGAPGGRREP